MYAGANASVLCLGFDVGDLLFLCTGYILIYRSRSNLARAKRKIRGKTAERESEYNICICLCIYIYICIPRKRAGNLSSFGFRRRGQSHTLYFPSATIFPLSSLIRYTVSGIAPKRKKERSNQIEKKKKKYMNEWMKSLEVLKVLAQQLFKFSGNSTIEMVWVTKIWLSSGLNLQDTHFPVQYYSFHVIYLLSIWIVVRIISKEKKKWY